MTIANLALSARILKSSALLRSSGGLRPRLMLLATPIVVITLCVACGELPVGNQAGGSPPPFSPPASVSPGSPPPASPNSSICGSSFAAVAAVVASQYGAARDCLQLSSGAIWVIVASGLPSGGDGAIGVEYCAAADSACEDGTQSHPSSAFNWYPIPRGASVVQENGLLLRLLTSQGVYFANFDADPPDIYAGAEPTTSSSTS